MTYALKIATAFVATILMILSPMLSAGSEFDRAHSLLQEIDTLQKHPRDKETVERLSQLVSSGPTEIEGLLNKGVLTVLNSPGNHSVEELHQKIAAALQVGPPDQYHPEVFVFSLALQKSPTTFFIGYNFGFCAACSRNWIGVVAQIDGVYQIVASDDDPLPNHGLTVTWLGPGGEGNIRWLVYGPAWGDAHSRLSVAVYSFDGRRLAKTWSKVDLPQGNVKVTPTEIIISYLTALVPPWSEKTETYSILPKEIKLRQSTERPNP